MRCQPLLTILLRLPVPGPRHSLPLLSVLLLIHLPLMPDSALLRLLWSWSSAINLIPTLIPLVRYCRTLLLRHALPTTSTNTTPITGTWTPAFSTATVGTTTYTFTPDAGQCATQATMDRGHQHNLITRHLTPLAALPNAAAPACSANQLQLILLRLPVPGPAHSLPLLLVLLLIHLPLMLDSVLLRLLWS